MNAPQRTMCLAPSDNPQYEVCGWTAVGPHPNEAIGYLQPLCARHLAVAKIQQQQQEE